MSRVLSCSKVSDGISASTVRVSKFLRTNRIISNSNSEIKVTGLTPALIVANIPINEETFTGDGSVIVGLIVDRKVRVVSVGEIHANKSAVNSSISVSKNVTDFIVSVNSLTENNGESTVTVVSSVNNVLYNGDLLSLTLNGAIPSGLVGGVITVTLNIL